MRVMHIQYAGDFAEAYERLILKNGKENYYGQKYCVSTIAAQSKIYDVMVLVLETQGYRAELEDTLSSVGLTGYEQNFEAVKNEIIKFGPDRVILGTPKHKILKFLRQQEIPTLPVFADSFENIPIRRLKGFIDRFLLGRELKKKSVSWIANHQINASKSIQNLGIPPEQILPYDWEHPDKPSNWTKDIPQDLATKDIAIFYAGAFTETKGIFDLIRAVRKIKDAGRGVKIKVAGRGEPNEIVQLAKDIDVSENIEVLGAIDHQDVLTSMNEADLVIVPSHHAYQEGLPMTIMESLMVHTPVIASDHPMFVGRVGKKGSVEFFPEKSVKALANKILSVCSDLETYKQMSTNTEAEWHSLELDLKWADLINDWLSDVKHDFSKYALKNSEQTQ